MNLLRVGISSRFLALTVIAILFVPALLSAEEFNLFQSDQYGFSIKFPATWIKIDKPKGNYYVVFQAPELTDNFRNRIHVAAHKPVKDPLKVFLQELRNGIKDLQKQQTGGTQKQQVKILDEGEFRCEIPGAYYFFIQAYEKNLKLWMDIVIVFFKHNETLLRISCLAPSKSMEQYHQLYNTVLTSVRFTDAAAVAPQPSAPKPAPSPRGAPSTEPEDQPGTDAPSQVGPRGTSTQTPAEGQPGPSEQPEPPVTRTAPPPSTSPAVQPTRPVERPAPRPGPRGPARSPDRPATGIVN
jgi:hypothetical protein